MTLNFSIKEAARALGGDVSGRDSVVCPGPNHGRKDRSLSVTFKSDGAYIVYSHAGDDFAECRDYVRARLGLADDWRGHERPRVEVAAKEDDADCANLIFAGSIVRGLIPVKGTPGEAYLRDERRIDVQAIADVLARTDAIGWHPQCLHEGKRVGAIVGIMTGPVTGERTGGISRTFIHEGRKVAKAMGLGPMGVVRLGEDSDVLGGLHIAEGLETCLDAMARGFRPMWSTGSTSIMSKFPVLAGVECLTIFADHDANGAGESAAIECGQRWADAGREVEIIAPSALGDFNDLTRGAA